MLIRVRFTDNQIRKISSRDLEELIRAGKVTAFERSSGWIEVDSASLRKSASLADKTIEPEEIAERRAAQAYRQLLRDVDKTEQE